MKQCDRSAMLVEIRKTLERLRIALDNAESCETEEGFKTEIVYIRDCAREILSGAEEMLEL